MKNNRQSFDKFFTLNTPNDSSIKHNVSNKEYYQADLQRNTNTFLQGRFSLSSFLNQGKFSKISQFYKNFETIFNEVTSDNTFMSNWFENLFYVFEKEIKFIFNYLKLKSSSLNISQKRKLIKNNIFVFKENLKHILNLSMEEFYETFLDKKFTSLIDVVFFN